jgi:hypothetical protein
MYNRLNDHEYNQSLKQRRPGAKARPEASDEEMFAESRAAAEAMREVDMEVQARLRRAAPCS